MSYSQELGTEDSFKSLITRSATTTQNFEGFYPFNSERLRFFINDNRAFANYNNVAELEDSGKTHTMKPGQGDKVRIEATESLTYISRKTARTGLEFGTNRSLQGGDVIRAGMFTNQNGWYLEQRGSDHADNELDIIVLDDGDATVIEEDVSLGNPTTELHEYVVIWDKSSEQKLVQGPDLKSPEVVTNVPLSQQPGNYNVPLRLETDAASAGLEMDVGSMSQEYIGGRESTSRVKGQSISVNVPSGNDNTWVPVYAMKIQPVFGAVNASIQGTTIEGYGNSAKTRLTFRSVHPSKTDASSFTPQSFHPNGNSIMEDTTTVTTVPDVDGNEVDPTSVGSSYTPGGHTLTLSTITPSLSAGSGGSSKGSFVSDEFSGENQVLGSDILVAFVRSADTSNSPELVFDYGIRERW